MLTQKPTTTCVIAGGAGFIGSYLCETLLKQNCFVICVDNFTSSTRLNIERFIHHPNFQFIQKDLNTEQSLDEITRPVDYIFHLAGVEAYMNGLNLNLDTLEVNAMGTRLLLDIAVKNNAKFLLGSSEQIYHIYHPGKDFSHYFGDTRKEEGTNIFEESKRFSEALTVEYAMERAVDARIVRLAFVYGPGMNLLSGNILAKMFLSAVKKTEILLPNDGLSTIYPTYITDAVYGITKAMFSQSSQGKIFGLVQPNSVTLLHLAYQIRDIIKNNLKISFFKSPIQPQETRITEDILKSQESLGWTPRTSIEEGIKNTFDWLEKSGIKIYEQNKQQMEKTPIGQEIKQYAQESAKPVVTTTIKPHKPEDTPIHKIQPAVTKTNIANRLKLLTPPKLPRISLKSRKAITIALATTILILLIIVPPLISIIFANEAIRQLASSQQSLSQMDFEKMSKQLNSSQMSLNIVEKSYSVVEKQRNLIHYSFPEKTQKQLRQGREVLTILKSLNTAQDNLSHLTDIITGKEIGDAQYQLQELVTALQLANEHVAYLEAEIDPTDEASIQSVVALRDHIKTSIQIASVIPDLFAFEDKKNLLLMIQDNHELRPTGGFLEAVGQITVEKGKILDLQVFDVYSLDNLLKGEINPPQEIKDYLGEENWWLRDANFSPHFPTAAARVAWFYQKERGKTVDGVLAINLQGFKTLLGTQETLYLPEFDETIDTNNIQERAQHHAEVNFFDGNGEKTTSFLQSITTSFFKKFKEYQPQDYIQFTSRLFTALENRNISVWMPDTSAQAILNQTGWDGALRVTPDQLIEFGNIDIPDYFATYDANFSVNKVNYNISKQLDHTVNVTAAGKVNVVSKTTYKNSSKTDAWPEGRYKTYTRFYLPEGAKFDKLVISDPQDPKSAQKISSKNIVKSTEEDKTTIGTVIEVPSASQISAEIYYTLPQTVLTDTKTFNYSLYLQKQSGVAQTPTTFTINHPSDLKVAKLSQKADIQPTSIHFDSLLDKDHVFAVSFLR